LEAKNMSFQPLANQPTLALTRLILLTDGTVMAGQDTGTIESYCRLTPDANGNYAQGTWSPVASPEGFAFGTGSSAAMVLASGEVLFIGLDVSATSLNSNKLITSIYDPVGDSWSPASVSDATAEGALTVELSMGEILCDVIHGNQRFSALFDPEAPAAPWSETAYGPYTGAPVFWVLLPTGAVLSLSMQYQTSMLVLSASEYQNGVWSNLPLLDPPATAEPIGAALLPSGRVFCVDRSFRMGLYSYGPTPSWQNGPNAGVLIADDLDPRLQYVPTCVEPSGKVLVLVNTDEPTWQIYAYDEGTNGVTLVGGGVDPAFDYTTQMLTLPSSDVLVTTSSPGFSPVYLLTPADAPNLSWAPQIGTSPSFVSPGGIYTVSGKWLNGMSQVVYGQNSSPTNYPLVRIRNRASGHVFYCRTFDHTTEDGSPSMGVAVPSTVSTQFQVPDNVEYGASDLCVIANGIGSCVTVEVTYGIHKIVVPELKPLLEWFRKTSEGDPARPVPEQGPEWIRAVLVLAEQVDRLQAEVVMLKSFIRAEERPAIVAPAAPEKAR
jgi:hypothetical protein